MTLDLPLPKQSPRRAPITLSVRNARPVFMRLMKMAELNGYHYMLKLNGKPLSVIVPFQRVRGIGSGRIPRIGRQVAAARSEARTRRSSPRQVPAAAQQLARRRNAA